MSTVDLQAVSEELRQALGLIAGLRTPAWGVENIQAPAAIVALPESVDFDETYGRGKDRYPDLPIVVLVGKADTRAAFKNLAGYAAGSGAKSVKAALEAYPYTALESVRVTSADFDTPTYAGTEYLAVIFHLDIIGKGA